MGLSRRLMLKRLGLSMAGISMTCSGSYPSTRIAMNDKIRDLAGGTQRMKIKKVESVRFSDSLRIGGGSGGSGETEFCWVLIHTDNGITGIGETYPSINAELGSLKDITSGYLLGKDPRDINRIWKDLYKYQTMRNAGGSEMHMLSAIDMALMDILGKSTGLPLYRLLGGKTRDKVKIYNTTTDYWAINNMKMGKDTREIVNFLLEKGITGMKIYPFSTRGNTITTAEIERGIDWLRQIDETAGKKMDILIDGWGACDLPGAERVIKACEPFNVIHIEDILLPDSWQSYAQLARDTHIPIAHSETIATRYHLKDFLESRAMDILMFDICWCGGITEARKMCDMADAYFIPASPHTCGGPLLYVASAHLSAAIPNFAYMESNYWKYTHQYPYFISNVPVPVDGYITPPEGPGLGVEIRQDLLSSDNAIVNVIGEL